MTDKTEERPQQTPSLARKTVAGAGWMIAWRMVTRGLGLISTLILARLLVPADFGLVALATSFAAAVDSMSEIRIQAALVRHKEDDPSIYDTAFTLQILRGLITGAVVALAAVRAGSWFGEPRLTPILFILAAVAVIGGLDNIAVVKFERELKFSVEFRLQFFPRILQFVLATSAAFAFRSYWALVVGVVVGRVARTVLTYVVQPYRPRLSLARWRELAGFSFWSWASSLAYVLWNRSDAVILAPAIGMGPLGVYLLASEIGLLPTTELIEPSTRALYAGVAAVRNRGTDPISLALPLMAALLLVVLPVGLGISATSGYVVAGLLGPNWTSGQPVISVAALLCAMTPITYVSVTVLSASGHIRTSFWAVFAASLVRIATLWLVAGTRRLDIIALAIAGVILCEAALFLRQLSSQGRLAWRDTLPGVGRTLAVSGAVASVLWLSGAGWQGVPLGAGPALLVGMPIGALTVVACWGGQFALWGAAGRPAGPERAVLDVAWPLVGRVKGLLFLTKKKQKNV